jgi:hypothetical protein
LLKAKVIDGRQFFWREHDLKAQFPSEYASHVTSQNRLTIISLLLIISSYDLGVYNPITNENSRRIGTNFMRVRLEKKLAFSYMAGRQTPRPGFGAGAGGVRRAARVHVAQWRMWL